MKQHRANPACVCPSCLSHYGLVDSWQRFFGLNTLKAHLVELRPGRKIYEYENAAKKLIAKKCSQQNICPSCGRGTVTKNFSDGECDTCFSCIEKAIAGTELTLHQLLQKRSLIKEAFKRFKIPQYAVQDQIDDGSIGDRAGGDVECPKCGLFYRDHPTVEGIESCIVTCAWKVYHI